MHIFSLDDDDVEAGGVWERVDKHRNDIACFVSFYCLTWSRSGALHKGIVAVPRSVPQLFCGGGW